MFSEKKRKTNFFPKVTGKGKGKEEGDGFKKVAVARWWGQEKEVKRGIITKKRKEECPPRGRIEKGAEERGGASRTDIFKPKSGHRSRQCT